MKAIAEQYIIRPLKIISRNSSVIIVVLVVIVLSRLTDDLEIVRLGIKTGDISFLHPNGIIINEGVRISGQIVQNIGLVPLYLFFFLIQTCLNVIIAQDLAFMYLGRRKSLLATLRLIKLEQYCWYTNWSLLVNSIYLGLGLILFAAALLVWKTKNVDLSFLFIIAIAALFPWFYSFLSFGSKIAAIPTSWQKRYRILLLLLSPKAITRIYVFYGTRLGLEFILLFLFPLILALFVFDNLILVGISTLLLAYPFTVLRGSTFEFFLSFYRDTAEIQQYFKNFYERSTLSR